MKVIILAGGFGTRLSEYTESIPKPMVEIGGKPILIHIMEYYASYGHKDFFIALGYKSEIIKNYFSNFNYLVNDFSIDLSTGQKNILNQFDKDWRINLIDTGLNSMTGGRLKRMKKYIENEDFMLTYGDGLSNVNLNKLLMFHKDHKKIGTVTSVRPYARFGEINLKGNKVTSFKEKPQLNQGWINGGFFIFKSKFFDYIEDDLTVLEKEPLEEVSKKGELMAFKHEGFWQCMDSKRDKENLEKLILANKAPWLK